MKIFNWIHAHQFSRNVHSSNVSLNGDGWSGQVRRSGSPIGKANAEKKPLLKQDVNVGQSWEFEGILTIGTLAIDPLRAIDDHDHDHDQKNDAKQSYINDYDLDSHNNNEEASLQHSQCEIKMCNLSPHRQSDAYVEMKCNKEVDVTDGEIVQEKTAKIEKRVTLLDLFLADQLEENFAEEAKPADVDYGEDQNVSTKKTAIFYTMLGGKKAKKLVPNDDDHSRRPMKKMQRFVTRMMKKKKIHPDMEARMEKKAQGKLNDDVPLGIDGLLRAHESASLLPINQGIMV